MLILLRKRELHRVDLSWELDGRNGTARLGDIQLRGFALLRDSERRLIAFHTSHDQHPEMLGVAQKQFVIAECDFKLILKSADG